MCRRKVVSGRKAAGVIRYLVNARGLQLDCARVLPALMYSGKTVIWKEK